MAAQLLLYFCCCYCELDLFVKCSMLTDWCCRLLDAALQILLIYGHLIRLCGVT